MFLWTHIYLFKQGILSGLRVVKKQFKKSKIAQKYKSHLLYVVCFGMHNGHSHVVIYFLLRACLDFWYGLIFCFQSRLESGFVFLRDTANVWIALRVMSFPAFMKNGNRCLPL